MKKQNVVLLVIVIIIFLALIIGATYAYFSVGNMNVINAVNSNTMTEQNNMVFDTVGGGMSLNISLAKMSDGLANSKFAAVTNTTDLTVNFTPNTDYDMVCTYDIVFEWTSSDRYTTHTSGVTSNEFTIQAYQTYNDNTKHGTNNILAEKDFTAAVGNNTSAVIVSGAKIDGSGSSTNTAVWHLISRIYNLNANQEVLEGKNFSGRFKVANVSCVAGTIGVTQIASGSVNENITWTLNSNGLLKITGSGAMPDYTSESEQPWRSNFNSIEYLEITGNITSIGNYNFYRTNNLIEVTISSPIVSIGTYAFSSTRLFTMTMPNTVTSLGANSFQNISNLSEVTLSSALTQIPNLTFENCPKLISINIPSGVTSIGYSAISTTGLSSITIPNSVTSIDNRAFRNCGVLTSVTYNGITYTSASEFTSSYGGTLGADVFMGTPLS